MDFKGILLSEKKSERERQILYDITYMWNLKYATNELIYETETDTENKLRVAKGKGVGEGTNQESESN